MSGFGWHPAARLIAPGGAWSAQPPGAGGLIAPEPPGPALLAAMGAAGFRIGGAGPLTAGPGQFETLSGGTLAAPRAIRRSFASWQASFAVNARLFGIGPGARVASLGSLNHSLALYAMIEALSLGAEAHLLAGLRPDRQRHWLADHGVTHLYATPAQLRLLLASPDPDLPALRLALIGGARLDAPLRAALAAASAAEAREFYGTSEASFIALSDAETPEGAAGRPYPGVEIRCPAGRVQVRSALLAEGVADAAGWCDTGETGRLQAGVLWIDGRADRAFRVAETWVQPERLEDFLLACPGIRQAAVMAVADAARGLVPVALVEGQGDGAAILRQMRGAFGSLAAPRALHWLPDWPLLPSGKTDLRALARWLEGVGCAR